MKEIKNLGIKTKEGIEVKNLQRFPSMEWGPDGGLQADVYLNNEYIGTIYQAGNGGCANFSGYSRERYNKIAEAGMSFLKRVDESYGPNSQYNWLKEKTVNTFDDDDIEAIVNNIEEHYDKIECIKKGLKDNPTVIICSNDIHTLTLGYKYPCLDKCPDVIASFKERIIDDIATGFLTHKYPKEKFTNLTVYLRQELESLNTL